MNMWISSPHLRLSSQWWWSLFQEVISGERYMVIQCWFLEKCSIISGMTHRDDSLNGSQGWRLENHISIFKHEIQVSISKDLWNGCQTWQFEIHISFVRDNSLTSTYPSISTEWSLKNGRWLHVFHSFPRNNYGINEERSLSDMRTWTISTISILEITTLFSGINLWIWSREIIRGFQACSIPWPLSSALVSAPVSGSSCLARGMEFRRLAFGRPEKITEIIAWRLELAHLIMQFHITVIKKNEP